ncbi:MAG: VCBS repeat-containing protein, partial [Ekhidna sp.]|nr:VCBS repeat-containing protein [Ekhidna sp.]
MNKNISAALAGLALCLAGGTADAVQTAVASGTRLPARDIDALSNTAPLGLWSDGTTMWVADIGDAKLYAYTLVTKARDAGKDIDLAADNTDPAGLWSDETTMYVADDDKIYAYTLANGTRDAGKDIDLATDNTNPAGLWSDETTMWVADFIDAKLYAYTLADGIRNAGKDIDLVADNAFPYGLWSDGITLWVADITDEKLYAYTLANGTRDAAKEFPLDADNTTPYGLWSDGITLWVADNEDAKLYAYTLATGARDAAKDIDLTANNTDSSQGLWSDGTTMWVADFEDAKLYAYTLTTGVRDAGKDIDLDADNTGPRGLWSDGTSLWVANDTNDKLYAYAIETTTPVPAPAPASVPSLGTRLPVRDINALQAAGNENPTGLWSDGTTMWVADPGDFSNGNEKLYAYTLATKARNAGKDIDLDADNTGPRGLWSDETTLWVADWIDAKLYAYTLANGARDAGKDIDLDADNTLPRGLWSDGTTMWVVDFSDDKLYAYTLADGARDAGKDIDLADENASPGGLWSDNTTIWVTDFNTKKLYAYILATGMRNVSKEFGLAFFTEDNGSPTGLWSDGTTIYVANEAAAFFGTEAKLYAYAIETTAITGTRPLPSAASFTEQSDTPFSEVDQSSIAFADVNGDGHQDVLITGEESARKRIAKLYLNDGAGNFKEKTADTPFEEVSSGSVAFADVDGKNGLDVLITGGDGFFKEAAKLYLNDGAGNFTEKTTGTPFTEVDKSSIAFADVNDDGHPDVLITGEDNNDEGIAKLYLNDGAGNFTEKTAPFMGVSGGSVAFADVDGKNGPDVLITGGDGFIKEFAKLYLNDGAGNFTEKTTGTPFAGVNNGSVAFADVNGNGHPDVLITGRARFNKRISKLYLNDGAGNFTEQADMRFAGVDRSSVAFADVDKDGDQDVLITGGTGTERIAKLYINNLISNTNTANNPPRFTAAGMQAGTPDENIAPGTEVGRFPATDPDGGSVTYSLTGDNNTDFSIDANGVVTVGDSGLDYETTSSYTLTVIAADDGTPPATAERTFSITVNNVNEAPAFANSSVTFRIAEDANVNATVGNPVTATDPDEDGVTYTLSGTNHKDFSIDENGQITVAKPLDYETTSSYSLTVTAADDADTPLTNEAAVTVTVTDVEETSPPPPAELVFEEKMGTPFPGVEWSSIAFADVDGDGHEDVLITGGTGTERIAKLYVNDGAGNFTEKNTPFTGV